MDTMPKEPVPMIPPKKRVAKSKWAGDALMRAETSRETWVCPVSPIASGNSPQSPDRAAATNRGWGQGASIASTCHAQCAGLAGFRSAVHFQVKGHLRRPQVLVLLRGCNTVESKAASLSRA